MLLCDYVRFQHQSQGPVCTAWRQGLPTVRHGGLACVAGATCRAVIACNHMEVYWLCGVLALAAKVQSMLLSGHSLLLMSRVAFAVICMQPGTSNSLQRLLAIQTCMSCCVRHLTRQSSTACICTAAAPMRRVFKHLFASELYCARLL